MTRLGLLLLVCVACAKKPAAKTPSPPPPTDQQETKPAEPDATKPTTPVKRTGDPCDGGEKPK